MSLSVLNYAKNKILDGDFSMAASYYDRALNEGVAPCIVNMRYLTKEYLVYPLEYEQSASFFELIKEIKELADTNPEYLAEYKSAAFALSDIRRLFLRSLSLFYFSDVLVSSRDSVVLREITEIHKYIKVNKDELLDENTYELAKYVPKFNKKKFAKDLNVIEAYCMNILLSYAAEQHSVYQGKKYSARTVDYGYFYSTTITANDSYYNYANMKPRIFMLGYEAYYHELREIYQAKLKEIGHFDSPKELKKELTYYVDHADKKDQSAKDYIRYAKHFEKHDSSRQSWFSDISKVSTFLNPLLKLNPIGKIVKSNVGSFELDVYFPQKKVWGVCSMLAAGKGWKVDTVRYLMLAAACIGGIGLIVYAAIALAMKFGFYFDVTIEKP